jgi:hypothetical protein
MTEIFLIIIGRGVSQMPEKVGRNPSYSVSMTKKNEIFKSRGGVTPHAPPLFTLLIIGRERIVSALFG